MPEQAGVPALTQLGDGVQGFIGTQAQQHHSRQQSGQVLHQPQTAAGQNQQPSAAGGGVGGGADENRIPLHQPFELPEGEAQQDQQVHGAGSADPELFQKLFQLLGIHPAARQEQRQEADQLPQTQRVHGAGEIARNQTQHHGQGQHEGLLEASMLHPDRQRVCRGQQQDQTGDADRREQVKGAFLPGEGHGPEAGDGAARKEGEHAQSVTAQGVAALVQRGAHAAQQQGEHRRAEQGRTSLNRAQRAVSGGNHAHAQQGQQCQEQVVFPVKVVPPLSQGDVFVVIHECRSLPHKPGPFGQFGHSWKKYNTDGGDMQTLKRFLYRSVSFP